MRIIILLGTLNFIFSVNSCAQNIFQRNYGHQAVDEQGNRIYSENDSTFVILAQITNSDGRQPLIIKVNEKGDIIWSHSYSRIADNPPFNMLMLSNGHYLVYTFSCIDSSCLASENYFLEIDTAGYLVNTWLFSDSINYIWPQYQLSNGDMIFFGGESASFPIFSDPVVMKTDSLLNLKWIKQIDLPWPIYLNNTLEIDNNTLLISGYSFDNDSDIQRSALIKIDTNCNLIQAIVLDSVVITGLFHYSAGSILVNGCGLYNGGAYAAESFFEVDTAFNVLWGTETGPACIGEMNQLKNGNFLSTYSLSIIVFDSSGNFIKAIKMYQNPGFPNLFGYLTDVIETRDGGILTLGSFTNNTNYPNANIILSKSDSTDKRCATGGYTWQTINIIPSSYPLAPIINPYFGNISISSNFINDTVYLPRVDDCLTNTAIENIEPRLIKVYPMPCVDLLTVKTNCNNSYELSFINALTGNEEMRVRSPNTEINVDVHKIPSGFYLLRMIENNKVTQSAKIIKL